jgi:hypothetical protein
VANPLVSIAVPIAGIIASQLGTRAAAAGWGAVFGEDAPTAKARRASHKDLARRRKQGKREGLSRAELRDLKDPQEDQPLWKVLLWASVSGVVLQGLREAARRGTKSGVERLTTRRPRPNRG